MVPVICEDFEAPSKNFLATPLASSDIVPNNKLFYQYFFMRHFEKANVTFSKYWTNLYIWATYIFDTNTGILSHQIKILWLHRNEQKIEGKLIMI